MPKLFNVKTRKQEKLADDQLQQAIIDGTHAFQKKDTINVLNAEGELHTVEGSDLKQALESGFNIETPKQGAAREFVAKNKGLSAAADVAIGQFADEALLGLPELIFDKTADPFDVAKKEALKEEHNFANTVGGIAGFGASLFTGAPLFKGASAIGNVVTKAVTKKLGDKVKESAAKKILLDTAGKAAGLGVEGTVISTPRAITELALGDPEAAAESLIMGFGVGSVLGGVGSAGKELLKFGKTKVQDLAKRRLDAQESAFKIIGASPANITKIKSTSPDVANELPDFLRRITTEDRGALLNSKKLFEKVEGIKTTAGERIGETINKIDDRLKQEMELGGDAAAQQIRESSFNFAKLANKIDDQFIKPNEGIPGFGAQIKTVKNFVDDVNEFIIKKNAGDPILSSPKALNEFRQSIDKLIKFEKDPLKQTLKDEVLKFTRRDIQEYITKELAPKVGQLFPELKNVSDDLITANKNFRMAAQTLPLIGKKLDREAASKLFGFREVLGGVAGGGVGGLTGVVAGVAASKASKIAENALDVAGLLLSEQAMKRTGQKLDLIPKVLTGEKPIQALKLATFNNAIPAILGDDDVKLDDPKAFKKLSTKVSELISNPELLISEVGQFTDAFADTGAPVVSETATNKTVQALQYINSIMPKNPNNENPLFKRPDWQPSDFDLGKFEKSLRVIMDPMTIIKDLKAGSLTQAQVEALDAVYPRLSQEIKLRVLNTIADKKENIPFNDRMKASLLLGIDGDINLNQVFIQEYQKTFSDEQKQKNLTPRKSQINIDTDSSLTNAQKITNK